MRKTSLVVLAALAAGCASVSMLQTASAVPEGQMRFAVSPQVLLARPAGPGQLTAQFPLLEASLRYGLGNGTDVGVKAGYTGGTFEVKKELWRAEGVLLSAAPSVGALVLINNTPDTPQTHTDHESNVSAQIALPLLLGIRSADREIVFGPRVQETINYDSHTDTTTYTWLGGSAGVAFHLRSGAWVMPEVSAVTQIAGAGPNHAGGLLLQAGMSFFFDR